MIHNIIICSFMSQCIVNCTHTHRFRRPRGIPDSAVLLRFLGSEFNDQFSSLTLPTTVPVRAGDHLPVIGSGGKIYVLAHFQILILCTRAL